MTSESLTGFTKTEDFERRRLNILPPQDGETFVGGRQEGGFIVERMIQERFGLKLSRTLPDGTEERTGGNAKWDAYTKNGVPVSVKAPLRSKTQGVPLSGWHRHNELNEDFYLVMAIRERNDPHNYADLRVYHVDHNEWVKHFPDDYIRKIDDLFDGVQGTKDYDPIWRKRYRTFKAEWRDYARDRGIMVKFNAKRGHDHTGSGKFQLRMQCSVREKDLESMGAKMVSPEELA